MNSSMDECLPFSSRPGQEVDRLGKITEERDYEILDMETDLLHTQRDFGKSPYAKGNDDNASWGGGDQGMWH